MLAGVGHATSACCSTNVPEYVFLLGGAALAGRVVVGINPTRRGDELARDIRHTDCAVVLTDAAQAPLLDGLDLGRAVHLVDGRRVRSGRRSRGHRGAAVPDAAPDQPTPCTS